MRKWLVCMAVLLAVCVLLTGCGNEKAGSKQAVNELVVENGKVTTNWYECAYPEAMQNTIRVDKAEGEFTGDLKFYVTLPDSEHLIFDLKYNNAQGDWTIEFEKDGGEKVPVSFVMYSVPAFMSENDKTQFFMAQEVVNDIVSTMKLK